MIVDKFIKIKAHSRNIKYFSDKGFELEVGKEYDMDSNILSKGSTFVINCKCDNCFAEKKLPFREYYSNTRELKEPYYCSKCKKIRFKSTCIERYGVDNPMKFDAVKDSLKSSLIEKYGVDHFSKTDEYKIKYRETCLEKYDTVNTFQVYDFKEKSKETLINRYGKEHYSMTDSFKKRYKKSRNLFTTDTYVKNLNMINYSILKYTDDMFSIYHSVCEKEFNIGRKLLYSRNKQEVEYCIFCNPIDAQQSHLEREITEFIKSFNIDVIENSRSIINSEIDIFLPKFKIAFEINGVYWHNEIFKDKSYHINKTNECIKSGIQLIHIWEDDWKNKKDIAKSMILNKINKIEDRIYARKCIIKKINDISIIRKFLNENHIQGYSPSMYKYGLFLNNELVSLMTFGWRKTNSKREFELIRFCNKINTNVIGSASKLFNFALTNIDVNEIISYCDISQFDGNVYNMLKFKCTHTTGPNYWWVVDEKRRHRYVFSKSKLVKDGFDPNKTEVQIMNENGYFRIFGCGHQKWVYTK